MTTTDTSAEAVERLIAGATSEPWEVDAAATLRALRAERDEARRNARAWQSAAHTAGQYREQERSRAEKAEAAVQTCRSFMQARGTALDYQRARAEEAEAERDRLRAALRQIAQQCADYEWRVNIAAAALAALKETGHE
jgi:chromosome segregation ATPase